MKNSELIARKVSKIKENDIDENGLNGHQRNGKRVAEIKANNIGEDGLNTHQRNGIKHKEWLLTEAGQLDIINRSNRAKEHQSKIDPITGLMEAKRRAKIMVETKINNIDELGLNGFERSHWKAGKNTGFIEGIFWQYSNERRFLERAVLEGTISKISRGPSIKYSFNNDTKTYFSDFIIDNTIYEIKSTYTMFGLENSFLKKNIAKLDAAKSLGYIVYVVIDDKTTLFSDSRCSISHLLEGPINE